jgi:hypothetical protein
MRHRTFFLLLFILGIKLFLCGPLHSQQNEKTETPSISGQLTLHQAVMCEEIFESAPRNRTVVFSVAKERAVCFTSFETVPEKTFIYHNWYYRDIPSARRRLLVRPPRWSTYSSIQIRKTDVGPWRVEITDSKGKILRVLRFSITE